MLTWSVVGVFFHFDFAPMVVIYTQTQRSLLHFLTSVCAIIGGVFTVAGLIDSLIFHADIKIREKFQSGKLS